MYVTIGYLLFYTGRMQGYGQGRGKGGETAEFSTT